MELNNQENIDTSESLNTMSAQNADQPSNIDVQSSQMKQSGQESSDLNQESSNTNQQRQRVHDSVLEKFFIDSLKDIYWAEKQLVKTLPKIEKAAESEELQEAIAEHLEVTNDQVSRLEQIFEQIGKKAQAKKCEAMEGLIAEGMRIIEETEDGTSTRDAALIIACQKN